MSARSPRRSFATPFVLTLAAGPACYVQSTPPPQQPMTTTTTTASTEPAPQPDQTPRPPTVIANPPRPQASTPNARWRIFKDPSGAGCQSQPVAKCPPNTACNPPRPQPYTCPTDMQLDTLGSVTIVSSADGMSCSVDYGQINCPKGAACNPPPPRSVTCPKQ